MSPVSENDLRAEAEPGFGWQSLRDLALSVLVVVAIASIVGFLATTQAHAQPLAAPASPAPARHEVAS